MNIATNHPFSFKSFLKNHVNGSGLLIIATMMALVFANTDLSTVYSTLCNYEISLSIGGLDLFSHNGHPMTIRMFANDMLMAIFFFTVGLEIKREFMVGELANRKHAMLPIIAAVGGIVFPVIIYRLIASDPIVLQGSAIPMATDIAFSLGVLSLLSKRIPISLKVFLTALAVVDDLAGIVVIAIFYSKSITPEFLYISAGLIAMLLIGSKLKVSNKSFYAIIGVVVWFMFYNSGVHATIAGVIVALCIPARPRMATEKYITRIKDNISHFPFINKSTNNAVILSNKQIELLKSIESASDKAVSPLQKLEDMLHPFVTYFVIPFFAFVNAGIYLGGITFSTFAGETTLAIMAGLLLGKFFGIFLFSYVAIKTKIVSMPKHATMKGIAGIAILGGIGFTVSIFIGTLSFPAIVADETTAAGQDYLNQAKLGILTASFVAAMGGYFYLKLTHKHNITEDE